MIEEKRPKLALVVGNDIYPEPYRSLSKATSDAGDVAGFLKHRLGFKVVQLHNKPAAEVERALSSLVKKLTDDSLFFFYFAGHGLCVGSSSKQSLLCADASELLLDGVVSANGSISPEALAAISRRGRGDMFFCLDVCRTQTLRQKGGPEIQRGGAGLRDAVTRPNGKQGTVRGRRLTLSSCADGQGANDDGAFASALIEEMTRLLDGGYELKLGDELVEAVTKRLHLGQTPVLDGERFVLVPGTRAPVVAPAPERQDEPKPVVSAAETPIRLTTEANAALQAGRYDEAERLASEALKIDPSFDWATYVLKEARKKLEERREEDRRRREFDQILNEGWVYLNKEDAKFALKKAKTVLKARPDDASALELKERASERLSERKTPPNAPQPEKELSSIESQSESESTEIAPQSEEESSPSGDAAIGVRARILRTLRSPLSLAAAIAVALFVLLSILPPTDCRRRAYDYKDEPVVVNDVPRVKEVLTDDFLTESRELKAAKKLNEALSKVEEALNLEPQNSEALRLKEEIKKELEDERVAKLLNEGWNALDKGEYELASSKADSALKLRKDDSGALELQSRIAADVKKNERKKQATLLAEEGERLRKSGDLTEAGEKVHDALSLDLNCQEALDLQSRIAVDVKKKESKKQAKRLAEDGERLRQSGDLDEASKKVRAALSLDSNCQEALSLQSRIAVDVKKNETKKRVELLVEEGEHFRQSGDLDKASEKVRTALALDSSSQSALDLQTRIATDVKKKEADKKQAKLLAQEGEELSQSGNLDEANEKVRAALALDSDCQAALNLQEALKEKTKIKDLLAKMATALARDDYEAAKKHASSVLAIDPENEQVKDLLKQATKSWAESSSRAAGYRRTLKIGSNEYGFCWIPAGEFDMGASESEEVRLRDELLHHVKLSKGFWMLETETTQALYREIMGENPSEFEGDNLPVESVSWNNATKFCAKLTERLPEGMKASLPTEAQWEYACRAGTTTTYWYGNSLDTSKANYYSHVGRPSPVKSYDPNGWGIYDMHGNVWEWCLDYYGEYPTETVTDPKGSNLIPKSYRVNRGGSWKKGEFFCRSAERQSNSSIYRYNDLGFRFLLICDMDSQNLENDDDEVADHSDLSFSQLKSSNHKAGSRQTLKIGNEEYGFCWIPAGEFDMGSPRNEQNEASANAETYGYNRDYRSETLHRVKLTKGFWMLETEVTQALYREVMGTNPSKLIGDDLPVEWVSWDEAMKFCDELTKRLPNGVKASLPTEAQWEYSCRAGTTTPYSFGGALNGDEANCNGNHPYGTKVKGKYVEKTTPVKSYQPNDWRLYDMHGNVWEWCLDYYGEYPSGTVTDPKGSTSASNRVNRGGSRINDARNCRSANRNGNLPDFRDDSLGFRFILSCD